MKNKIFYLALFLTVGNSQNIYSQHYRAEGHTNQAYEEAVRLADDGHFYAAGRSLKKFIKENESNSSTTNKDSRIYEAEALSLVCDYFLGVPNTDEAIQEWLNETAVYNQYSLMADRLKVLNANLLVRNGKFEEAIDIYRNTDLDNLNTREYEEALLCNAIAYMKTGDYNNAEAILQALQDSQTHSTDVIFYTTYLKYVKEDYQEALNGFSILQSHDVYGKVVPMYIADCYLRLGNPDMALSSLSNYKPLEQEVKNSTEDRFMFDYKDIDNEVRRIYGEAYFDKNDYLSAIQPLQQYCKGTESPKRAALYKLGMSLFQTNDYKNAASVLSQSASTANDIMAQSAWLNAGISYLKTNNKKSAQIAFQQASEMSQSKPIQEEALYNYALCLHEGNTMGFGESVTVFEKYLNMFPNSQYAPSVSKHLTEVYFTTKNYQAALASINKIKNPDKDIIKAKQTVLYNLGAQEFIKNNYKQSDIYTSQAIQLNSSEALYIHGESSYRQGRYSQAINDLQKYVSTKKGKNHAQALYSLGYSYFKQKKYSQAKNCFSQFIDQSYNNIDNVQKADALNRLADCLYTERQYDKAYATYQQAIDCDKASGNYAIYQQAYIDGLRGNYDRKVSLLNQLTDNKNTSDANQQTVIADALYEQGRALIQTGARQKAAEVFTQLTQRYPQSQQSRKAYNELGMLLFESGNTEAAENMYKTVINQYPNTTEAHTALANLRTIFTQQGRINEYSELATKAGKSLGADELDQMINEAAINSMDKGDYSLAYKYYDQLIQQTQSDDMAAIALEGKLRSAFQAKDYNATVATASQILQNNQADQSIKGEALLYRAESYLALNNAAEGVKDLQTLSTDKKTVYGAQATIRLAQYAYDTDQYTAAEQILTQFIDSGSTHQYWLARGFILLADVYNKTDRKVEAQEYLLSLKSNYNENEEINKMIEERLK